MTQNRENGREMKIRQIEKIVSKLAQRPGPSSQLDLFSSIFAEFSVLFVDVYFGVFCGRQRES